MIIQSNDVANFLPFIVENHARAGFLLSPLFLPNSVLNEYFKHKFSTGRTKQGARHRDPIVKGRDVPNGFGKEHKIPYFPRAEIREPDANEGIPANGFDDRSAARGRR